MPTPTWSDPVVPRRSEVINKHKAHGKPVAAVFPIHYPRALFRAFDLLPVEVWGPPAVDTSLGDEHLQVYTCGIVRCGLSFLLRGGLDVVDVIVVPHACDSLQGLGSILLDLIQVKQPVIPFYMPRNKETSGVEFLAAEFECLAGRLADLTGREPSRSGMMQAIQREESADALLARLLENRTCLPLTDREFYRLVRSREFLPAEDFVTLATDCLVHLLASPRPGVPIVLSGILPEPMEILDPITGAGGMVAADDFACVGRRIYPAGQSQNPFMRLAESLLGAPPDSMRGSPVQERIDFLLGLVERTGAKGVVFYVLKFCEPEQFYLPQIRRGLKEAGILSLEVEGDLGELLPQQSVTRIEAFLECIP